MPELPEVEMFSRYFAEHALNREITKVEVRDERILGMRTEPFRKALRGERFTRVRRHGKNMFAEAGRQWLHLHFGMSGDLAYYRDRSDEPRFARVVFGFRDGSYLAFEDMRLFGVVDLTSSPDVYIDEHKLGPDAIDPALTLGAFRKLIAKKRGAIKSVLMTQETIAGVGNLYADETLFHAGVRPARTLESMDEATVKQVHAKMRAILKQAVKRHAAGLDYPSGWLIHHREEGAPCSLCGGPIARSVVFGRTTYYCSKHQR